MNTDELIARVLSAGYELVTEMNVAEDAQIVGGKWYNPKWGCDSLDYCVDELRRLISSMGENQ